MSVCIQINTQHCLQCIVGLPQPESIYECNALNLARITRLKRQYNILPIASALIVFIHKRKIQCKYKQLQTSFLVDHY